MPQEETGTYAIFDKDGSAVAGLGPPATPGQPSTWSMYVATDDADSAADRVEAAGGEVLVDPFDVSDQGRMAVFADPAGAAFSVWQPKLMKGAELLNAPGVAELERADHPGPGGREGLLRAGLRLAARGGADRGAGPEITYTGWRLGNQLVAGMMPTFDRRLPGRAAGVLGGLLRGRRRGRRRRACRELGGVILVPPRDLPAGRLAVLNDPQGALFCVIRPESQD